MTEMHREFFLVHDGLSRAERRLRQRSFECMSTTAFSPFFPTRCKDERATDKKIRLKTWKSAGAMIMYQQSALLSRLKRFLFFFENPFATAVHSLTPLTLKPCAASMLKKRLR